MADLLILGAGGHGKVVAEIALMMKRWENIAFLDDNSKLKEVDGIPVIGKLDDHSLLKNRYQDAFVALGDNRMRLEWYNKLLNAGFNLPTLIHPFSSVSQNTRLGAGTVVMPGVVINTGTTIGNACIINTGSSIDHDCVLADGVHISPGVHAGGTVRFGTCTWAGLGSNIINNIDVGSNVIIAAGAVVTRHVPDNVLVTGCPAKVKKRIGDGRQ
jgi:sugar O-acyltransferase (sialic acid O-acetyltransferase NeuD family)